MQIRKELGMGKIRINNTIWLKITQLLWWDRGNRTIIATLAHTSQSNNFCFSNSIIMDFCQISKVETLFRIVFMVRKVIILYFREVQIKLWVQLQISWKIQSHKRQVLITLTVQQEIWIFLVLWMEINKMLEWILRVKPN